jgi:hypothetical protein
MDDRPDFSGSVNKVEAALRAGKKVAKGAEVAEAGFDRALLSTYGMIARRCRDDRELGLSRYPYEAAPSVSPFVGGFFSHPEWPVKKGLEKHASLRTLAEYEAHYVNAAGYWMFFGETARALRDEHLAKNTTVGFQEAERLDTWVGLALRYGLRVVGLRTEFFRLSAKDPQHARLVMPALENQGVMAATDDIEDTMEKLDTHLATQLMKAAATLSANNAVGRSGAGGAAP